MKNYISEALKRPEIVYFNLMKSGLLNCVPDRPYLELTYRVMMGKKLDLDNPSTFTEKLQWIKLYDQNPIYTDMVDKYRAKEIIKQRVGESHVIPTLAVANHYDEIDFSALPERFVIKCNHDSGGLIMCHNKNELDHKKNKKIIEKCLSRRFFKVQREWPYKNVKPKVICEEMLELKSGEPLSDYKIFCFNGKPTFVYVTFGRGRDEHLSMNYYDLQWNLLPVKHFIYDNFYGDFIPPVNFDEMLLIAEKMSEGIPFLRVDLYNVDGHIYVGELTFFPDAGYGKFNPLSFDKELGDLLVLPKTKLINGKIT